MDSGPLHLAKLLNKPGALIITSVDEKILLNKLSNIEPIKNNFKSNYCSAPCGLTNIFNYKGKRLVLNIFPSIDTNVCATSVRNFNERAKDLDNTEVLCISRDLPFAQKRFTNGEELKEVITLSDFQTQEFGKDYGLEIENGPFKNLLSRVVIVLDEEGKVIHSQQVTEIADEPDYLSALKTLL